MFFIVQTCWSIFLTSFRRMFMSWDTLTSNCVVSWIFSFPSSIPHFTFTYWHFTTLTNTHTH
jgi:hypothetical protein